MSVVLLVRHGQASFGAADYDVLSSLGEEQSRLLGASLAARGVHPDVVVRGSMKRHRQTAVAAVEGAGWEVDVVEDAAWDEFDHLSRLRGDDVAEVVEGDSYDERVVRVEESISRWASGRHDDEYRESFPVFQERVTAAMRSLVEDLDPKQTAVVFTSGGPVSWITTTLASGGLPTWERLSKVVVNSGVTKVVTGRRGTSLIAFNDHSHLEHADADLITYR
jgi:broad specificity phosphatase PhoE